MNNIKMGSLRTDILPAHIFWHYETLGQTCFVGVFSNKQSIGDGQYLGMGCGHWTESQTNGLFILIHNNQLIYNM